MRKIQFLPLTGIRFFLALWVVVFHLAVPFRSIEQFPVVLFCLLRTGYLGVEVFFILSGFVLAYNYPLGDSWPRSRVIQFAAARFGRIYPTYCLGLILIAPLVVLSFWNLSWATVRSQTIVTVLNVTLLQSWSPKLALSWNAPGWSLSCEAFFYCCFPWAGVALWRRTGRDSPGQPFDEQPFRITRLRGLATACLLIWAASMIAPLLAVVLRIHGFGDVPATSQAPEGNSYWANLVRFNPLLRMPEFLMGILLARAYDGLFTGKSALLGRGYYLYVPGMILEIAMISQGNSIPAPLVHGGLFLPIHSLVILGLALGGGPPARLLSTRPIVFLGKASYSLYILHMPLFWWMDWIHRRVFSNPTRDTRLAVFHLLTVVSLSAIVFQFLEEPLSRIARRRFGLLFGVSDENRARSASAGG